MKKPSPTLTIKNLPQAERPRERLCSVGPEAVGVSELLAIILRTGTSGTNALVLADKLLLHFGNLKYLAAASVEELAVVPGIGHSKAVQLKAAFELGRRLTIFNENPRPVIDNPRTVVDLLRDELRLQKQEVFKALILDTKNQLLKIVTITIGTLNANIIHPRELFRPAIALGANSIVIVHNHPSGDPEPSKEDIQVTRSLVAAGEVIGIGIFDHIIIGDSEYVSLKERGCF